ncbi:MerR family transcriptional regulator [Nocardia sp. CA-107356]|uniref:MerR family transcriptional regulator n=1 Tax=Nocardia sp. CA-107356 TaxID=3239972 RepID=UPI003D935E4E
MKSRPEIDRSAELSIGEVAARFDLATHVLRHWETMGLLHPAARVNGRRRYTQDHVVRVAMIMRGKAAGLSLEQLREMLDAPDRAARRTVLERQHAELDRRIAEARASQRMIEHAMECDAADFTQCPTFHRLVAELIGADSASSG